MATRITDMDSTESGPYEFGVTESVTSSSSTLIPTDSPPTPYERRNTFRIGVWDVSLFWANVFFACVVVAGRTGLDVSFPMWINSTAKAGNRHAYNSAPGYFILSFASLSFVAIFGLGTLFIRVFSPRDLGVTERSFPHSLLFLLGLCNALNGVQRTVFASKNEGMSGDLLPILGNFTIPLTVSARWLYLKKRPTIKKLLWAAVVAISPVIYFIGKREELQADVWIVPLISCLPVAMMYVLEERGVKTQYEMSRRGINLVYFLFWTSTYQFLCVASALLWVDILLASGNTNTTQDTTHIVDFGRNWWYGLQCFFGAAGCNAEPAMRGTVFISIYVCTYVGSVNMLRHSEGATWLAIVQSLAMPLRNIFWSFFTGEKFNWETDGVKNAAVFVVMVFASLIYNRGAPEISLKDESRRTGEIRRSFVGH